MNNVSSFFYRVLVAALSLIIFTTFLTSCNKNGVVQNNYIKTYTDVPGITQEEIAAIEALKTERGKFICAFTATTEAFENEKGEYAGANINVAKWLTEFFDIEFEVKHYPEWPAQKSAIDNLEADFSCDFTQTPERMEIYYMTMPIAGRGLNVYTHTGTDEIKQESDIEGLMVGFLEGTVAAQMISEYYPDLPFDVADVPGFAEAAAMLKSGEIDAFITDAVSDTAFAEMDYIRSRPLFQFVYSPMPITTKNPDLQPIIKVIDKYLISGGIDEIFKLQEEGNYEYKKYKLNNSFTDEEKAYLEELRTSGKKINIAYQHDAYPANFYNTVEKRFDGAAVDILAAVGELTGIVFDSGIMPVDAPLANTLASVKDGTTAMTSQLLYSKSRENDYIWSDISYINTKYALLSKKDYPNLEPFQVYYSKVGTVDKSVHEEIFHKWFPEHENVISYHTGDEAFLALEKGEIDLLMLAETMVLVQTNYRENPNYKVNISFSETLNTFFGYNKNEVLLRNVIDKAMLCIDIEGIEHDWMNRLFDYSKKIARTQAVYSSIFAVAVLLILIFTLFLFQKNRKLSKGLLIAVDEAREASEVKSRFLANMSHEIRTPMNAVIGMSELLLNEPLTERQRSYTHDINVSSQSLLCIINDILDFSKIEAGKLEFNCINFNLEMFIENICSMIKFVAQKKELEFKCELDDDLPKCIYGDDVRLRQVLTNLCGNAAKFTNKGHIKLSVRALEKWIVFEVSDTGIGIREEDLPNLFEAFTQMDATRNRNIKGTGLGLAISKNIISMMDGKLEVSSVYGVGTTFTVSIPKAIGSESDQTEITSNCADELFAPEAKILVVDDNALNLKVASGLLGLCGIRADIADSGKEAIALVQRKDYDMVFMDHMMPDMDGIETTSAIRALGDKYSKLIIIALSANAVSGAREMFLANGMDDFLSKPIEKSKLINILSQWLPKDLIIDKFASRAEHFQNDENASVTARKIDGLSFEIGLDRVGGIEDLYYETLEDFFKMINGECEKLQQALMNNDLRGFSIIVHGLKSMLATIGAVELSSLAYDLEMASKLENLQFCEQNLPPFINKLQSMAAQYHELLGNVDEEIKLLPGKSELLAIEIERLREAISEYDYDLSLEVAGMLIKYDFGIEINESLARLHEFIGNFDFDSASILIEDTFGDTLM